MAQSQSWTTTPWATSPVLPAILPGELKPYVPPKKNPELGKINPPKLDYFYITLTGYGLGQPQRISVLCGDDPPTITDGYARWSTVDRPLRTSVTVFTGYQPARMTISLRFGVWDADGWSENRAAGAKVESDISALEWMAGAHRGAGAPPIVYANTFGPRGASTGLIPTDYQHTAGMQRNDKAAWPWVIEGGISWGKSIRAWYGERVYQECTFQLLNYLALNPQRVGGSERGGYFKTRSNDTILKIAGAPSSGTRDIQGLAQKIKESPKNNPVLNRRKLFLKRKSISAFFQPGIEIWVPAHSY